MTVLWPMSFIIVNAAAPDSPSRVPYVCLSECRTKSSGNPKSSRTSRCCSSSPCCAQPRTVSSLKNVALSGWLTLQHRGYSIGQGDIAGLRVLRFPGSNGEVSVPCAIRGFKTHVSPFKIHGLANPKTCIQQKQGHVAKGVAKGIQVGRLLPIA